MLEPHHLDAAVEDRRLKQDNSMDEGYVSAKQTTSDCEKEIVKCFY